jgi:hypothetical protein
MPKRRRNKPQNAPVIVQLNVGDKVKIRRNTPLFASKNGRVTKIEESKFGFTKIHVAFRLPDRIIVSTFARDDLDPADLKWEGNSLLTEQNQNHAETARQCVRAGAFDLVNMPGRLGQAEPVA